VGGWWVNRSRSSPEVSKAYHGDTHIGEKERIQHAFGGLHISHRLVTTTNGRIVLANRKCEADDLVCVLLGGRMPLILRKQDDHYIFMMESYIDGLMDGQAINELEKGNFQLEDFELR
jgi:hypothetical protein